MSAKMSLPAIARAIQKGGTVSSASLIDLASAYLKERETPRLKESDFYAGRLSWGWEDADYREGSLVCLSALNEPDIWLDPVEGGYQIVYSSGGNGLYRYAAVHRTIGEADDYLFEHHLRQDIKRYPIKVRRFKNREHG